MTGATAAAAPALRDRRAGRVAAVNLTVCGLLLAQYLLGMVANLFVTIPAHHPGAGAANYFSGSASGLGWVIPNGPAWLAAHASLGLALVLAAIGSLVLTWGRAGRLCTTLSAVGLLAIIGAGFNGLSFLTYNHNFSSMIMAGLWALALACYLTCVYLAGRRHAPPAADSGSV
jgi:hypothetical protein